MLVLAQAEAEPRNPHLTKMEVKTPLWKTLFPLLKELSEIESTTEG